MRAAAEGHALRPMRRLSARPASALDRRRGVARSMLELVAFCLLRPAAAAGAPAAAIDLASPYIAGAHVAVDFQVDGLFDASVVEALRSGLPASLVIRWELWRDRASWWDTEIGGGGSAYKILFDVVDESYGVFDSVHARMTVVRSIGALEQAVCSEHGAKVAERSALDPSGRYYVMVEARLEPLEIGAVRDLEQWLRGGIRARDGGGLFSGVPRQAVGVLKGIVGLGERSAFARTPSFRPGELQPERAPPDATSSRPHD
jgi:hypothetical protein